MKIDKDVLAVWSLAAMEAGFTGWEKIEPYHFLGAALKFVEIDLKELTRMLRIEGDLDKLTQLRDTLADMFVQKWQIEIPQGSSAFRRALRKTGTNDKMAKGDVMHRSGASRRLFETAAGKAAALNKITLDLCVFIDVILRMNDKWITKIMKKLGLPLNPKESKPVVEKIGALKDVISFLVPEDDAGEQQKKDGIPNPAAVVLNDRFSAPDPAEQLPCLLINDSSTMGKDLLQKTLDLRAAMDFYDKTIGFVPFNRFYETIFNDTGGYDDALFDSLLETTDSSLIYFFNSLSNYFSEQLLSRKFVQSFTQWVKRTDGRFVFEISPKKYDEVIKSSEAFHGRFNLIFLCDPIVIPQAFKL